MNNDKDNATLYAELKAERFMTDMVTSRSMSILFRLNMS